MIAGDSTLTSKHGAEYCPSRAAEQGKVWPELEHCKFDVCEQQLLAFIMSYATGVFFIAAMYACACLFFICTVPSLRSYHRAVADECPNVSNPFDVLLLTPAAHLTSKLQCPMSKKHYRMPPSITPICVNHDQQSLVSNPAPS